MFTEQELRDALREGAAHVPDPLRTPARSWHVAGAALAVAAVVVGIVGIGAIDLRHQRTPPSAILGQPSSTAVEPSHPHQRPEPFTTADFGAVPGLDFSPYTGSRPPAISEADALHRYQRAEVDARRLQLRSLGLSNVDGVPRWVIVGTYFIPDLRMLMRGPGGGPDPERGWVRFAGFVDAQTGSVSLDNYTEANAA